MTQDKKPKRTRLAPDKRSQQILDTALKMAARDGLHEITRDGLADEANVSQGLITHYFENMDSLRSAIMVEAIKTENIPVVAEGVRYNYPEIHDMPGALKEKAVKTIIE